MGDINTIGPRQIKAARALLDWSQEDLAAHTALSVATIRKLELGHISPRLTTTGVIRSALENAGLEFIEPDGVRRRPEDILTHQGREGAAAFFEDMLQTLRKRGGDIMIVASSESELPHACATNGSPGLDQLLTLNGSTQIKCILTDATEPPISTPRFEFRFISKHYVDPIPFFVYGDKYAMVLTNATSLPKIIVVQSPGTAAASRRQFLSMWEKATPFYAPQKIGAERNDINKSRR